MKITVNQLKQLIKEYFDDVDFEDEPDRERQEREEKYEAEKEEWLRDQGKDLDLFPTEMERSSEEEHVPDDLDDVSFAPPIASHKHSINETRKQLKESIKEVLLQHASLNKKL